MLKKQRFKNKIKSLYRLADLPECAVPGTVSMHMYNHNRFTIDGSCEIIRYTENIISLKSEKFLVTLYGENLKISCFKPAFTAIAGNTVKIEYTDL